MRLEIKLASEEITEVKKKIEECYKEISDKEAILRQVKYLNVFFN